MCAPRLPAVAGDHPLPIRHQKIGREDQMMIFIILPVPKVILTVALQDVRAIVVIKERETVALLHPDAVHRILQ